MTIQLTFRSYQFELITRDNKVWFTSVQLIQALEYVDESAVNRIYARHSDEFSSCMTTSVKLTENGINNSLREIDTRLFSLRGAHLVAMFARTPVAKEFRKWVLDILDNEMDNVSLQSVTFGKLAQLEIDCYHIQAFMKHFTVISDSWWHEIYPALVKLNSPLACRLYDRFKDGMVFANFVNRSLNAQLSTGTTPRRN
ncbi:BRO family protein [Candidatus Fukatsuia symbiotica]|uniref:Bro-N domain-containing protein n=1 Tax=Candidatus Fukatsuia symbiotica TaxID=1878942 RepID=A0A2U8I7M1_9GAMM|nr:BRO family protein [Candidatus Fukatsuia symbiotica]AWK14185.1 hypothetical protein CCS41_06320 [Candidatus Fukatsuia symbiotica]MEA9446289.1 BRO family protein [Candidatus Fukatsuia symbiotica]